jgi:4,5:9,10-diseco-3-hydroxy-5,9,17-trioxoandrosta-1(10),2-diene-4-oate hydrolase
LLPREDAAWRREEIVAAGIRSAPVLAEAWRSFAAPDADIRSLLRRLTMPVLFAWGLRDRALRWAWVRPAAIKTPRGEVVLFDAGHAPFLERPDMFDAALLRFATGDLACQ